MTKSALRKLYLARQRSLSPAERAEKSRSIAKLFFLSFDITAIDYLHCFIPIKKFNEVDTLPIFQTLWADHPRVRTVVPRVNFQTGKIESVPFAPDAVLIANEWDIEEPVHQETIDEPAIDMVLVPGVCFDRNGHRVGYGKGFYDRFLAACRPECIKIGLSYFPPIDSIDDAGEHDVRLDHCLTPGGPVTAQA